MMAAQKNSPSLVERLPVVRGRYTVNAPLAKITWFKVGGVAEVMFRPADIEDLAAFLRAKPKDVAVSVIGVGSNILVRDGGIPGVVLRLGREFARLKITGTKIHAGAATLDINVAAMARDANIAGMEFLGGIPGTIGGALRMNCGCYGSEMKDIVISAKAIDENGAMHDLTGDDLGFAYRSCAIADGWIFVSAVLQGQSGESAVIARRLQEITGHRQSSQPRRIATGGSTFANPPEMKAWQLIEQAGCRGLKRGGASVSAKHCNFLVNDGSASAADIEGLGEEVRRRVFASSGVKLQWEIRRIGIPAKVNMQEAES